MGQLEVETEMAKLDDLLEQERSYLLAGDLKDLSELSMQKEDLIGALNSADRPDPTILKQLDGKLRRNQLLFDGALEGIRSVTQRIAALKQVRQSLDTYDRAGQKQHIKMGATHSVEKRA